MTVPAPAGWPDVRPPTRPVRPQFSTGPTAKPPVWTLDSVFQQFHPGRSHRAAPCKAQLLEIIERSKALLGLPKGWEVGIVPASDTGAIELALWTFVSDVCGADVLSFDSFSATWAKDLSQQLALTNLTIHEAPYGHIPDLSQINFDRDVILTWNGTTAGTCLPDGDFIPKNRTGLTICDATSAAFAMVLPYDKLDVITWSWQKSLGGEGGHGMIALSPRALARLARPPVRPLPKIFQLKPDVFKGATINTPSMLAVADHLVGLKWAEAIGGLPALIERTQANYAAVAAYVEASKHWDFLATDNRSPTALCLTTQSVDPKAVQKWLTDEGVALDISAYRDAPPGLRLWGGPTVETQDLEYLMPWIEWATNKELTHG